VTRRATQHVRRDTGGPTVRAASGAVDLVAAVPPAASLPSVSVSVAVSVSVPASVSVPVSVPAAVSVSVPAAVALGLVVALASPRPAVAQTSAADVEAARAAFELGDRHFKLAEYDRAIEAYKESYRRSARPELFYNIAQAHRLKGDCPSAVQFYRRYLKELPDAPNRERVTQHLATLEPCPAAPPPPTPPTVSTPSPPPTPSTPARPPPAVEPPAPGEPRPLVTPLPPSPGPGAPPSSPTEAPGRGRGLRIGGLVLAVGGTLALAGTAGAMSWLASASASDVQARFHMNPGSDWNTDAQGLEARGRSAEIAAAVLYGGAGVAAVTGVALAVVGWRRGRAGATAAAPPPVALHLSPQGAGLRWSLAF